MKEWDFPDLGIEPRTIPQDRHVAYSFETLAVARVFPIGRETNVVMPSATGFFLETNHRKLFITNKHVVTARDFFIPNRHLFHGATPGNLVLNCFLFKDLGNEKYFFIDTLYDIQLFHPDGTPRYFTPSTRGEMDVAVFDLGTPKFNHPTLGDMSFCYLRPSTLHPSVMDTVFVVGHPDTGIFKDTGYSVFKRGIIASEPSLSFKGGLTLVDANTKKGMSGSPVLHKPPNIFEHNAGVIGVYSGRDEEGKLTGNSELGLMWPLSQIVEEFEAANPTIWA